MSQKLEPLKVYKGKFMTWYYTDKKGKECGYYCDEFAAYHGLEDYLEEEELKDAEATRVPKESS